MLKTKCIRLDSGAPTQQNFIYYLKYYQLLKRLGILKSGPKIGPGLCVTSGDFVASTQN